MIRKVQIFLLVCFLAGSFQNVFAQIDNIDELLRAGVDDANSLIQAYLEPFGKGFGADLNNGWYSSAKTHHFLGFDITVSGNAAVAPEDAKTFSINDLGLQNLVLSNPAADPNTPTIVGDETDGPDLNIILENPLTGQPEIIGTLTMPQGIGFRYVPSLMVQGSLGLFLNTDLIVRYFPEVKISNEVGKLQMFGFGVKHNLTQWLPGGSLLPFDLAVMAGVTKFQATADLEVLPDPNAIQTGATYENQRVDLEATSVTFNLLASKKLSVLTIWGSVGIETSNVDLKLKGNYPVTLIEPVFGNRIIQDFQDPVNLSFDGPNTLHVNTGLKLELIVLSVYAGYSFSNYPVVTAGVGFSIR